MWEKESKKYLWHEDEAECARRTKDDEHWDEDKGGVGVLVQHGRDGDAQNTHDGHIIDWHTHIPAKIHLIK